MVTLQCWLETVNSKLKVIWNDRQVKIQTSPIIQGRIEGPSESLIRQCRESAFVRQSISNWGQGKWTKKKDFALFAPPILLASSVFSHSLILIASAKYPMAPLLLITLAMFGASAIAAPQFQPPPPGTGTPRKGLGTCDISSTLVLPSTQTALVPPSSPASFVLLGVGFQNYTCSSAGTYTYVFPLPEQNIVAYYHLSKICRCSRRVVWLILLVQVACHLQQYPRCRLWCLETGTPKCEDSWSRGRLSSHGLAFLQHFSIWHRN